jgi:hypothetical protein
LTVVLNRSAAALLVVISFNLGTSVYASAHAVASQEFRASAAPPEGQAGTTGDLPDIYYIILDGYARGDVLRDVYGYDNSRFLNWLRQTGFYVADQSHSNYAQTMLSLASSLNLDYLEAPRLQSAAEADNGAWQVLLNVAAQEYFAAGRAFGIDGTGLTRSRLPLAHMIQFSTAARTLREHGYRYVAFTSGYGGVQMPNADVIMRAEVLDDFEENLIEATPIPRTVERLYDPIELHRNRVRFVFDHLADDFGRSSPVFVFAHILCPHIPFTFRADGTGVPASEVINDDRLSAHGESYRATLASAYGNQIEFVNRRIEAAIAAILSRSSKPPIIIVQADHGSEMTLDQSNPSPAGLRERMSILNAYYVPDNVRSQLYPEITPVNTFRMLFRSYFRGRWERLPDQSYFSTWGSPYEFKLVSQLLGSTPGLGSSLTTP